MDELVRQAMARWPNVPAVFGWLRLDRRGNWLLVDRGQPGFDETVHGAGSPISSPQIVAFIERNYAPDETGRWYWQNGPQRVFVDLDVAPLVLRVLGEPARQRLVAHTGRPVGWIGRVLADAGGNLLVETDLGPGAIDDRDLAALDIEIDAPSESGAAAAGEVVGRLRLMGDRQVLQAAADPAAELGFVRTPR
jgi:hypothetical protein